MTTPAKPDCAETGRADVVAMLKRMRMNKADVLRVLRVMAWAERMPTSASLTKSEALLLCRMINGLMKEIE